MKELFDSIWNAPKEEVLAFAGNVLLVYVGGVVGVGVIIILISAAVHHYKKRWFGKKLPKWPRSFHD